MEVQKALLKVGSTQQGTVVITLNRPDKRNALSIHLMEQLIEKLEELAMDQTLRVVILRGEGPVFCSGLDLNDVQEKKEMVSSLISSLLQRVYTFPCPTIAAVHGAAVAGGAGLLAACDLAVAERGTKIGFPETRRGLVGAFVSSLLSRQIRGRDMKELLLVGELVDAERAYEMGLINKVTHQGEAFSSALALASQIRKGAPDATVLSKQLIDLLNAHPFEASWKISQEFYFKGSHSKEAEEGALAFLEQRKPQWEKP